MVILCKDCKHAKNHLPLQILFVFCHMTKMMRTISAVAEFLVT